VQGGGCRFVVYWYSWNKDKKTAFCYQVFWSIMSFLICCSIRIMFVYCVEK
jgi:hypothetical protein